MTRIIQTGVLLGVSSGLALMATHVAAQGLFDFNTFNYRNMGEFHTWMAMSRVVLATGAIASGFAVGWVFSPGGKHLRAALGIAAVIAAFALVIANRGPLGWIAAVLVGLFGFLFGVGYWLGQGVRGLFDVPTTFGSAKWADVPHMAEKDVLGRDGIILGGMSDGTSAHKLSYKGDRHLFTYAPTRSGKGVAHIIPNLLSRDSSVLVIDIKGENLMITGQARAEMGQQVLPVDPWDIASSKSGFAPVRINPLDWIQLADPDAPENAMILADSIIQKNDKGDPFWQQEAMALLQGLIMLVAFDANYQNMRNLGTVRDLLLLTGDDQVKLFEYMANSPHALIASTGARCLQKEHKLMANVLASAQAETHMLDSQRLRDALEVSDFDFADLKKVPMSVFLIIPTDRVDTFSRFLRLMVQQALTMTARNIADKPEKPVLFILDEMPALGRLSMVEQAYGLMAGFGMQIWGIAQDLCQMRRIYGEDHETFIANSGAVAYFGSPDKTSADYFSALCGETTVWNFSSAIASAFSFTSGQGGGSQGSSSTDTDTRAAAQRKLVYPDELRRMDNDLQLVLIENARPIIADKHRWFEDPDLASKGVNIHTA